MIREAVVASLARPTALVSLCDELRIPRSTVYAQRSGEVSIPLQKRGPKPLVPDENLLAAIRDVLTDPPFMGEGYRKVHARLRYRGIHADVERIRLLFSICPEAVALLQDKQVISGIYLKTIWLCASCLRTFGNTCPSSNGLSRRIHSTDER